MHAHILGGQTGRFPVLARLPEARTYCSVPQTCIHRSLNSRTSGKPSRLYSNTGQAVATAELDTGYAAAQPAAPPATRKVLTLRIGAKVIPHPDKVEYGGEDAHFISDVGGGALGVADGVGGWADSGINPADYSKFFMVSAREHLEGRNPDAVVATPGADGLTALPASLQPEERGGRGGRGGRNDYSGGRTLRDKAAALALEARTPVSALQAGHGSARLPGSCTACVLRLDRDDGMLHAANVGDSGFLVARHGATMVRSQPLQHFFDCPLQFGAYPEHTNATDNATDAQTFEVRVRPGDVVVLGTDGLWDNCFEEELLPLLPRSAEGVEEAAAAMAELAVKHATDEGFASPYSQEAIRQGLDIPWWEKLLKAKVNLQLPERIALPQRLELPRFELAKLKLDGLNLGAMNLDALNLDNIENVDLGPLGNIRLGSLTGGKLDDITVLVAYVDEEEVSVETPAPASPAEPRGFFD